MDPLTIEEARTQWNEGCRSSALHDFFYLDHFDDVTVQRDESKTTYLSGLINTATYNVYRGGSLIGFFKRKLHVPFFGTIEHVSIELEKSERSRRVGSRLAERQLQRYVDVGASTVYLAAINSGAWFWVRDGVVIKDVSPPNIVAPCLFVADRLRKVPIDEGLQTVLLHQCDGDGKLELSPIVLTCQSYLGKSGSITLFKSIFDGTHWIGMADVRRLAASLAGSDSPA